jgi:hypothetical protein
MVNLADSQEAERRLHLSKDKGNRSAERKRERRLRRRQGRDNLLLTILAAPERKFPGPLCLNASFVGRLYQAPIYDLLVVGKAFLIQPLFPVRDQTCSNWILSNVVPLFVN